VQNRGFGEPDGNRADDSSRIGLVNFGRSGSSAIRLTTQNLDDQVKTAPGGWERSMIGPDVNETNAKEGVAHWWAHSVYFPTDLQMSPEEILFFQFNVSGPGGSRNVANLNLNLYKEPTTNSRLVIRARVTGAGGLNEHGDQYLYSAGGKTLKGQAVHVMTEPWKGVWYDFVHHVKWSRTGTGFHRIWMRKGNGPVQQVLDKPNINTLHSSETASRLTLGTYHDPVPVETHSLIHDRIRRGKTFESVAMPDFVCPTGVGTCN
jgi:hypothetical protein